MDREIDMDEDDQMLVAEEAKTATTATVSSYLHHLGLTNTL